MHPYDITSSDRPQVVTFGPARQLLAVLTAITLTTFILIAVVAMNVLPTTVGAPAEIPADRHVDGWSVYLGAASATSERAARDGWGSYLLAEEVDPATVGDGWMSRYGRDD